MSYLATLKNRTSSPGRRWAVLALTLTASLLQAGLWLRTQPTGAAPSGRAPGLTSQPRPENARAGASPARPVLGVPPPPGEKIPEGAILLYERRGAATSSQVSPAAGQGANPASQGPELYPTDLLRALILLERGGELKLTTAQARALLPALADLQRAYGSQSEARQTITGALSEPQRLWLRSNPAASEERPGGIPEVRAGDLARELQGLLEAR